MVFFETYIGFCQTKRHLEKEGGTRAGVGEELDFKVLEFSKENKKSLKQVLKFYQVWRDDRSIREENEIGEEEHIKMVKFALVVLL